jgi:hypothetical protein
MRSIIFIRKDPPIIHRDIKPHNLKLTTRGDIILLDFGLAKLNSGETTGAVSVFGYSRTYSPLEQIQGTGTDARSDIFALGATAYHLLTGKPAVDALTRAAAIVAGKPDPLRLASEIKPEIPVSVATVIHSALALNPDMRFTSAKAMRHALEYAVNEIESDNVEDLPEEVAPVIAPIIPIVNSAEAENFPALEAFAEAVNSPEIESVPDTSVVEILTPQIATPEYHPVPYSTTEVATKVATQRKMKSRTPLAALAAALIGGILTVFYFAAGANSLSEPNQSPVVQTASASEEKPTEKSGADSVSPTPMLEAVSQTKTKPAVIKTTVEKPESGKETLIEEKADEESTKGLPPVQASKPLPPPSVKTTRRTQPRKTQQRDGEERSRIVEEEPISDIESIFTGQTPKVKDNENSRQKRRGRGNQMSDEEREQRRERRERRRERQNRQSFPPF